MKKRYAYYIPLFLLFIIAATYQARFIQGRLQYVFGSSEGVRWPLTVENDSPVVISVNDEAAEQGLHKGDQIISVNGRPYVGKTDLYDPFYDAKPGDQLTVRVRHESSKGLPDEEKIVTLRAPVATAVSTSDWLFVIVLSIVTPTFCLLLGFFVAGLRPKDPLAWLLLGLMLSFGQVMLGIDYSAWRGWTRDLMVAYQTFFRSAWGLWMLLFGIYFPERLNLDRRLPWLKWLLVIPQLIIILKNTLISIASLRSFSVTAQLTRLFSPFDRIESFLLMASIGLFFACIGWKMGTATSPDARRRLRLLLYGSQISLSPAFFLFIYSLVRGVTVQQAAPVWITLPALLLFFLFPLTFAYVIVVHRAMDVGVVIRQGLQYALARGGVRVLQVILVISIILASILLADNPRTNRTQKLVVIGLSVLLVFLIRQSKSWTRSKYRTPSG